MLLAPTGAAAALPQPYPEETVTVKSAVETLSPTRVRLTVEVPFQELEPDLRSAYRKIGRQVRISGFRPGKVPPRLLDQRVGRGTVLQEAVEEAIPRLYSDAIRENSVAVLGQPEVDITRFTDGDELVFTADVDVRPQIELPAWQGLAVEVDDADPTEDEIEAQLSGLRDRFAVLRAVDRPAADGDYVSLDLSASVDGTPVPEAESTGLSYEMGSGGLVPGLDEALSGATEGETRTFQTELVAGQFAGRSADVSATLRSVKVKDVPELDDDFAQTASEFDTIAELRADVSGRLSRVKRLQQGMQARDKVLEALLARIEVPLPESVVESEFQYRLHSLQQQVQQARLTMDSYLRAEGRTQEELEAELRKSAADAVKSQLVLDALADAEELGVSDAELTEQVVRRAQSAGVTPDDYVRRLVEGGQLPVLVADIRRGKALATVLDAANITDASGRPVDLDALREDVPGPAGPGDGAETAAAGAGAGTVPEGTATDGTATDAAAADDTGTETDATAAGAPTVATAPPGVEAAPARA